MQTARVLAADLANCRAVNRVCVLPQIISSRPRERWRSALTHSSTKEVSNNDQL